MTIVGSAMHLLRCRDLLLIGMFFVNCKLEGSVFSPKSTVNTYPLLSKFIYHRVTFSTRIIGAKICATNR